MMDNLDYSGNSHHEGAVSTTAKNTRSDTVDDLLNHLYEIGDLNIQKQYYYKYYSFYYL